MSDVVSETSISAGESKYTFEVHASGGAVLRASRRGVPLARVALRGDEVDALDLTVAPALMTHIECNRVTVATVKGSQVIARHLTPADDVGTVVTAYLTARAALTAYHLSDTTEPMPPSLATAFNAADLALRNAVGFAGL